MPGYWEASICAWDTERQTLSSRCVQNDKQEGSGVEVDYCGPSLI